jgi:hypothetical protein
MGLSALVMRELRILRNPISFGPRLDSFEISTRLLLVPASGTVCPGIRCLEIGVGAAHE